MKVMYQKQLHKLEQLIKLHTQPKRFIVTDWVATIIRLEVTGQITTQQCINNLDKLIIKLEGENK